MEISFTQLSERKLTVYDGEVVIRNQQRVFALLGVRKADIPEEYHDILAEAKFISKGTDECIVWYSNVFKSRPVSLSELDGEEKDHYRKILDNAILRYINAISSESKDIAGYIAAAISYHSYDNIYCADDRVVITEWGMSPVKGRAIAPLSIYIDEYKINTEFEEKHDSDNDNNLHEGYQDKILVEEESEVELSDDIKDNDFSSENKVVNEKVSIDTENIVKDGKKASVENEASVKYDRNDCSVSDKNRKSTFNLKNMLNICFRILKWMFYLFVGYLLLLLLVSILCSRCSDPMRTVMPVTPELENRDIVLSKDSITNIVSNRLLIILTDEKADMEEFVKEFRVSYSDDKYILSNLDTVVNRITLTLPVEERELLRERLPQEFGSFGLVVIPETMYKSSVIPNDPAMKEKSKSWYFDFCGVFDAWDVSMGDEDIVVAVIDDGFDLAHPEFKGKIVKPYNAVSHDRNIYPSPGGHGTHVAATAVGLANNNNGISGIAPGCKLMPIQVGNVNGMMTTSAIMDAVIYAINEGADVVNMSLGMHFGPIIQQMPMYIQLNMRQSMFLEEERIWNHLFSVARQRNVTFVLAGGNENILIGIDPMSRSSNTIKVSAVDPFKVKAGFSNYGDYSTLSAPGVDIYNAIPGNNYDYKNGTSMASPIVAGGCALMKSMDSNLTTSDLIGILRETGIQSPSDVGPIVNFSRALNYGQNVPVKDECDNISERYYELIKEIERIKREHPDCIQVPDTLTIPEDVTVDKLAGKWKSTTSIYNTSNEEVVLYFTFNGTDIARLDAVEQNGDVYSARMSVCIEKDEIMLDQFENATSPNTSTQYSQYSFELVPDKNRHAEGVGQNKNNSANIVRFKLIRL